MPAHMYTQRHPQVVKAIQIHPSEKSANIIEFCPSLQYLDTIHFPSEGRPIQEHPGYPFFEIDGANGKASGELYDWIIEKHTGFYIIPEHEFAHDWVAI